MTHFFARVVLLRIDHRAVLLAIAAITVIAAAGASARQKMTPTISAPQVSNAAG